MAVYREDMIDIDRKNGSVFRSFANQMISEGDEAANRYGGRIMEDGEPVDLTGCTVTGYFIRPDRATVLIEGNASGNEFYVNLPEACYAETGVYTLAIKVTGGGTTSTIRIIDGTVVETVSGDLIDPGGIIPDIDDLMAVIYRAEEAAETIGNFVVTEELISGTNYRLIVDVTEEE